MGSSSPDTAPPSAHPTAEFLKVFTDHASTEGVLRFDAFVELALYHPEVGYYRRAQPRVGYRPGTDFFTSATSGKVFGELVCAAVVQLLGNRAAADHAFVEIGAEPDSHTLREVAHPFRAATGISVGEAIELSGPCVIFSNELFDAQPFRRFRFRDHAWCELGVRWTGHHLEEIEFPTPPEALPSYLPSRAANGYLLDAPSAAAELSAKIASQAWSGLFLALDYGKTWRELTEAIPGGTGRAYFRHTQHNDLLARPGFQDLTCHICWDWLADSLKRHGFSEPVLETQESFFIRRAERYLAPALAEDAGRLTPRKQSLLQLLHGAHLGQKFQALHALR